MTDTTETPEINWGYNCLTSGIHHGRPEALWNLPLRYAALDLFDRSSLETIVLGRIFNDALQYVDHGSDPRFDDAWAARVRARATELFLPLLKVKIGELSRYYKTSSWEAERQKCARLVSEGDLNPAYQPLHPHDSINTFCRIIGTKASRAAYSPSEND